MTGHFTCRFTVFTVHFFQGDPQSQILCKMSQASTIWQNGSSTARLCAGSASYYLSGTSAHGAFKALGLICAHPGTQLKVCASNEVRNKEGMFVTRYRSKIPLADIGRNCRDDFCFLLFKVTVQHSCPTLSNI